jgi:prophage maintenance system killer protein
VGELVIYENLGETPVQVRLEGDTVWLTQRQMAELYGTSVGNVWLHLQKVYAEQELSEAATIEEYSIVQIEGRRRVTRSVIHYNLDAILSVGYRVNSKRGTQFRIWATRTLRDQLTRGFSLNESRLLEQGLGEVQQAVTLLGRTLRHNELVSRDGLAVLSIIESYTSAWRLLPAYDAGQLSHTSLKPREPLTPLTLDDARVAIAALRADLKANHEPSGLFGLEHSEQLAGILGAVEQTFDGSPIYASAQVRAANLLYFVVKDHPFVDGNKRIGALLFLEYLRRHDLLNLASGAPRLDANAIVALTLLIAESDPRQKSLLIRLVLGMLDDGEMCATRPLQIDRHISGPTAAARDAGVR